MKDFDVTPKEAIELQKPLRDSLKHVSLKKTVKYVAGAFVEQQVFFLTFNPRMLLKVFISDVYSC